MYEAANLFDFWPFYCSYRPKYEDPGSRDSREFLIFLSRDPGMKKSREFPELYFTYNLKLDLLVYFKIGVIKVL